MPGCAACLFGDRSALQATPTRKDISPSQRLSWLQAVFVLIGLGAYLLLSRSYFGPTATQGSTALPTGGLTVGPLPTRTQEPVTPSACVENMTARIRRGPGPQYETIGGLVSGVCFTVLGRNEESSWVYIVSDDHQTGWMTASLL